MIPGLYDNPKLHRRELWLEWKGLPIFYGWCHQHALASAAQGSVWEREVPFGNFPKPE